MLPQLGFAVTPKTMFDCPVLGASLSPRLSSHRSIVAKRQWPWCPFTSAPKNNTSEAIFAWRIFTCLKAYDHSFLSVFMQAHVNLSIPSFLKDPNYPYGQESIKYWLPFFYFFLLGGWLVLVFSLVGMLKKKRNPDGFRYTDKKNSKKRNPCDFGHSRNRIESCKCSQTDVCANCNSREGFQPA